MSSLLKSHPSQVRAWDFRAALNDAAVQEEMLRWVGVAEPVLVVGEVTHASQPLPEPSTRDLPCCPPSLRAPCVLREVLEAATMDLSSLRHYSIQQRGLVLPRGRGHCPVGAARPFWRSIAQHENWRCS